MKSMKYSWTSQATSSIKCLLLFRKTSFPQATATNPRMFCEHPVMLFIPYEFLHIGLPLFLDKPSD